MCIKGWMWNPSRRLGPSAIKKLRSDVGDMRGIVQSAHSGEANHEDRHQAANAQGAGVPHGVRQFLPEGSA